MPQHPESEYYVAKNVSEYEIPIETAVTMLSKTPAELIGAKSKGGIEIGKDCDILIWNDDFSLNKIIGEMI